MDRFDYIVIHHSLTKDGQTVSMPAIRKYHTDPAGPYKMKDIGYHGVIEQIGDRLEFLVGRPWNERGSHCKNADMNRLGFGLLIVGDFDVVEPSIPLWNLAVNTTRWLMELFEIPAIHVIGHREAGAMDGYDWKKGEFKTCPGKLWPMDIFRACL